MSESQKQEFKGLKYILKEYLLQWSNIVTSVGSNIERKSVIA